MQKKTVYQFAKKLMSDKEFNNGGIISTERAWLDAVGFRYEMYEGCVDGLDHDAAKFYEAMETLLELNKKYSK